jgi:hypothetical protein
MSKAIIIFLLRGDMAQSAAAVHCNAVGSLRLRNNRQVQPGWLAITPGESSDSDI